VQVTPCHHRGGSDVAPAGMQGSPNTGSTMQWTIIRPGGLKSEPATGSGILTEDRSICGAINREDVAELVVKALFSDKTDGKVRRRLILTVPDIDFTDDALTGNLRIMALSSQHCDINKEDVRRTRILTPLSHAGAGCSGPVTVVWGAQG
jgi:hypothetical protein